MAAAVKDLTTFYANLPSIFESEPPPMPSFSAVDTEKTYQPMFGSFLFADSEPLTRAVFVASSPTTTSEETQKLLMDDCTVRQTNSSSTTRVSPPLSLPPLAPVEDIDDENELDEDDFDGIPVRHAFDSAKKKINGENDSIIDQTEHDRLLSELVRDVENENDDGDDDIELLMNGFTDEQHDPTLIPSLFKDIPDIDDPNGHDDDDERIPFDPIDMLDRSDSLRSSSPDSLFSSSHLHDEHEDEDEREDDDDDDDDDVAQWNDEFVLGKSSARITTMTDRPSAPLPPPLLVDIPHAHLNDHVDFIDSSRSNSRCSNASSQLSAGYADQARMFMSDDGLVTSSDSENNDNENFHYDIFERDLSEEPHLQVDLDRHRSISTPTSSSSSTRSSSPIINTNDETPIVSIDDDESIINPIATFPPPSAPIAVLDDDDLHLPVLPPSIRRSISPRMSAKNFLELCDEHRQTDIIHDILDMRHLLDEYNDDDEFLAVMHDPSIFEQILHDDEDNQKSNVVKQTNAITDTFRSSSSMQLSTDNTNNKISSISSLDHHTSQASSSPISDNRTSSSSSFSSYPSRTRITTTTTTNNRSPGSVNEFPITEQENAMNVGGNNVNISTSSTIKQKTTQENANIPRGIAIKARTAEDEAEQQQQQQMSSGEESDDDDSELLNTLAQLHGLIDPSRTPFADQDAEEPQQQQQSTKIFDILPVNMIKNPIQQQDFSHTSTDGNEENEKEVSKKATQQREENHIFLSSTSPTSNNTTEKGEKKEKNPILHLNQDDDDDDEDDPTIANQRKKHDRKGEKAQSLLFLPTPASTLNDDDDSHTVSDSNASVLFLSSSSSIQCTTPINQLIADDLQTITTTTTNTRANMNNDQQQNRNNPNFDPFAPADVDEVFVDVKDADVKEFGMRPNFVPSKSSESTSTVAQPLVAFDFDELWNQSMAQMTTVDGSSATMKPQQQQQPNLFDDLDQNAKEINENYRSNSSTTEAAASEIKSTTNEFNPSTLTWDSLINDDNNDEFFKTNTNDPFTWETLFGGELKSNEEQQHHEPANDLNDYLHWIIDHFEETSNTSEPLPSTENLEQIMKNMTTTKTKHDSNDLIVPSTVNLASIVEQFHSSTTPKASVSGEDFPSSIEFTSTHNLENIIRSIEMNSTPFDPIPSPPLHVDHSVTNPMINATHHDLFPIDELDQQSSNLIKGQESMILYEEDEDNEEANEMLPIVDQFVANTLTSTYDEINQLSSPSTTSNLIQIIEEHHRADEFNRQVNELVERTLSAALEEIYNEQNVVSNVESMTDVLPTDNLVSIVNWHDQSRTVAPALTVLDPFDQKFDSVWSSQFDAPDNVTTQNLFESETIPNIDPWLTSSTSIHSSNLFDEPEFSSLSHVKNSTDNDETPTLSEYIPPAMLSNPSDSVTAANNLMKYSLTAAVLDDSADDSSTFEDVFQMRKNEPTPTELTTESKFDENSTEIKQNIPTNNNELPSSTDSDVASDDDETNLKKRENLFSNQARLSQFEAFASEQPLKSTVTDSKFAQLSAELDNEFDEPSNLSSPTPVATDDATAWTSTTSVEQKQQPTTSSGGGDDEPWELEDSVEEKLTPVPTTSRLVLAAEGTDSGTIQKNDSYNNFFPDAFNPQSTGAYEVTTTPTDRRRSFSVDEDEESDENYDAYFAKQQQRPPSQAPEDTEIASMEQPFTKTVRFDDKVEDEDANIPKDSLEASQNSTNTESENVDINDITPAFHLTVGDRITDHMEEKNANVNSTAAVKVQTRDESLRQSELMKSRNLAQRPDSQISMAESEDLPPPLPPLPPLNDNIPTKSTALAASSSSPLGTDTKRKFNLRTESEITPATTTTSTIDTKLRSSTDTQLGRPFESALLRSTSNDDSGIDSDEVNGMIACVIDNNPVNIDCKTIAPFKCVIGAAGHLQEENQTAVIVIYGCWLPDHRLREYRYIMDQLFYYVYHKLEKLVTNDYVLVYFHGATPKHRTPDLKFLRKCYQMINLRLRKNLRAVYVVHPTRWLRTVIALSRPFFSNKFYHKVNYLYTIAELERQFPHNHLSIPVIIEQTDWLYSQKYDRHNASIQRSVARTMSRSREVGDTETETSA